MAWIIYRCTLKGTSPLLQHSPQCCLDAAMGKSGKTGTRRSQLFAPDPRAEAEKVAYKDSEGFYIPGSWIFAAIRDTAVGHKQHGSRRTLKYVVPGAVRVVDLAIPLLDENGKRARKCEVDSRMVKIPATKAGVPRHRPRFDEWEVRFSLRINDELIPCDVVKQILDEAGDQNGLGDFRPQKSGQFGTFTVTQWEEDK